MNNDKNEEYLLREKLISAFETYSFVLTQTQKQVFALYYVEDLSLSEIAQILATTRSAIHDALKKSKKKIAPFLEIESNK